MNNDQLTPPIPPRSRFFWFTSLEHTVQAALIGLLGTTIVAIATLVGVWYSSHSKASGLEADKAALQNTVSAQKDTINTKIAEIQRLETLLTPFKTIAIEKYTGTEAEALRQLASQLQQLQDSDTLKTKKIVDLEVELQKTKELAQPNSLVFKEKTVRKTDKGLVLSLLFVPTKNEQLGMVALAAVLPAESNSKITDFWPHSGDTFLSGDQSKKILEDGRTARLTYKPLGMTVRADLTVTEPTTARIEGNLGIDPLEVEIK